MDKQQQQGSMKPVTQQEVADALRNVTGFKLATTKDGTVVINIDGHELTQCIVSYLRRMGFVVQVAGWTGAFCTGKREEY